MKLKRKLNCMSATGPCTGMLKEIAKVSDGKVILAQAATGPTASEASRGPVQSNWGHNVSIMPCGETLASARAALESLPIERTNIFGVCIHHTDGETAEAARKALKAQGFSTHIIIDKNGDATVELPFAKRAAACVGFNKWMFQIDVVGRLHLKEPTEEQLLSLYNILELLSCGRPVANIDSKFAAKCRKMDVRTVQDATEKEYAGTYTKYYKRAQKKGSWSGVLDQLPFLIIYHGEVRPTKCCGKFLIEKIPDIMAELRAAAV